MQGLELPTVINLNPRSIYNKADEFKILLEQYQGDLICISESWERENLSLSDLLQLENYKIIKSLEFIRPFSNFKPKLYQKWVYFNKYHKK